MLLANSQIPGYLFKQFRKLFLEGGGLVLPSQLELLAALHFFLNIINHDQ